MISVIMASEFGRPEVPLFAEAMCCIIWTIRSKMECVRGLVERESPGDGALDRL